MTAQSTERTCRLASLGPGLGVPRPAAITNPNTTNPAGKVFIVRKRGLDWEADAALRRPKGQGFLGASGDLERHPSPAATRSLQLGLEADDLSLEGKNVRGERSVRPF